MKSTQTRNRMMLSENEKFTVCDSLKYLSCYLKVFPNFASVLVFNEQTQVLKYIKIQE